MSNIHRSNVWEARMQGLTARQSSRTRMALAKPVLQNFVRSFVDLVYPPACPVCKQPLPRVAMDTMVCLSCWSQIALNEPPFCHGCGRQMSRRDTAKNVCSRCMRKPRAYDRAYSVCVYDGAVKTLIHEFKYNDKQYLGRPLSRLLIDFIKKYDVPVGYMDYLIPVPLHGAKLREREFNQAQILCAEVARAFDKPVLEGNLFRYRATDTQATLEPHQRFLNVKGCFGVTEKQSVTGRNFLLIDDVLTTGATASEAAGALKDAGANIVFALTLAS
ncbi:MAG: ComF family protein [Candidatus Omnitrophica bacterium]|nr:ComF family protein [Candidatus Omnitrophota bacterium]